VTTRTRAISVHLDTPSRPGSYDKTSGCISIASRFAKRRNEIRHDDQEYSISGYWVPVELQ
jgi:hypothetical protein